MTSNLLIASGSLARVPGIGLLNRTFESWADRHEVQLLRGLPKDLNGCVAQREKSKRLISARLVVQLHPQPPNLRAGDVTDSIEVLQTSREGLSPSQSTKLRRSSMAPERSSCKRDDTSSTLVAAARFSHKEAPNTKTSLCDFVHFR